MGHLPWEILDESAPGKVVARLPSDAANPLEALERAMTRMRGHIAKGSVIGCVAVADVRGTRIAQVTREDALKNA